MSESEVLTVGILGGGTMGVGIATVMARAGHRTIIRDLDHQRTDAGLQGVRQFIQRSVELGKLDTAESDDILRRLSGTSELGDLAGCDVVVEAIFEDVRLKAEIFGALDEICDSRTLFHTNTSTLSVTEIASGSRLPNRVVGTHYCNPAALMKLVEVVKARQTDAESYGRTVTFLRGLGKTAVTVQDSPGFIVNRFLVPFENDCVRALASGIGTVESIDSALINGLRYPMGVFRLLDVVGLDIHKAVSVSLFDKFHDRRYACPPLIDQMISSGDLGRKAGRGFYSYEDSNLFGG